MITDSQRLDWLQGNQKTVYRCVHSERQPTTMDFPTHEMVMVFDGWAVDELDDPKPTIRAAIDEAMNSTPNSTEGK